MDTSRYLDELMLHTTAFADAMRAGDRGATVPTCPDWTLADLATHLGRTHRWVATVLRERREQMTEPDPVTLPESVDETSTWLLEGAGAVGEELRACGDHTPVAGFAGPVPARFWGRRMAAETLVHRFDAELTAGVPLGADVAPDAAADAIDEGLGLLEAFGPAFKPELGGAGETLHVHLTDVDGEWVITRESTGPRVERVHRKADVAVRGPATVVLAVLTNRRAVDDVEVLGDAALLTDWRRVAAI